MTTTPAPVVIPLERSLTAAAVPVVLTETLGSVVRTRTVALGDVAASPAAADGAPVRTTTRALVDVTVALELVVGVPVRILTAALGAVVVTDDDGDGASVLTTTWAAGGVNAEPVDSVAGGEA